MSDDYHLTGLARRKLDPMASVARDRAGDFVLSYAGRPAVWLGTEYRKAHLNLLSLIRMKERDAQEVSVTPQDAA